MAKEWGTPIIMLGRTRGDCAPCAAARGVGDIYARALPAGSVGAGFKLGAVPTGMGPEPWAGYPGTGGPNQVVTDIAAPSPEWFRNTITMPVISPSEPQSRQRVFNGGLFEPEWTPRAGKPIRGYAGLGNLVRPWAGDSNSFTMGTRGVGCINCPTPVTWWTPRVTPYSVLGAMVAGTHGYLRNKNVGWALGWAACGFLAPIFTNAIAIVQGLGKSKTSAG